MDKFYNEDFDLKPLLLSAQPEALGMESSKVITVRNDVFTDTPKDSIRWIDLVVRKSVPKRIFKKIYVIDPHLFESFTRGIDYGVYRPILSTLKDDGTIYVYDINDSLPLIEELKKDKFQFKCYDNVNGKIFQVYRRPCKEVEKVDKIEKPVIEVNRREYEISDIDFSFLDNPTFKTDQITLKQFEKEIRNEVFLYAFKSSIEKLLTYKVNFYLNKMNTVKKKFNLLKRKVKSILDMGLDRTTVHQMYPMYEFYAGFIFDLQEIYVRVLMLNESLDLDTIRRNLHKAIYNNSKGLASIIGRRDIKDQIVSKLYAFAYNWKVFTGHFCNFALLGPSGVGKTSLGKVLSFIFAKSGILATEEIYIVTRSDLIGQYVGQTAPRTRSLLLASLEGVLFIDEAYQLAGSHTSDFGHEAITEIVNFMDKYIGMSIVIVAGYERDMKENFFRSNEGLDRRFPYQISLKPYSPSELTDILITLLNRSLQKNLDRTISNHLFTLITSINQKYPEAFNKQAGDMLNLSDILITLMFSSYSIDSSSKLFNLQILKVGFREFLVKKDILLNI